MGDPIHGTRRRAPVEERVNVDIDDGQVVDFNRGHAQMISRYVSRSHGWTCVS